MHRFSTTTPPRLSIEFRAGDISIDTQDVDETTVELRAPSGDSEAESLIRETVIDQRGGDIVVRVPKRSSGLFRSSPELHLEITAPEGSRLNVQSASADLAARGSFGESRLASGSGDVFVEEISGAAQVRAGSGDVHILAVRADVTIGTGSGDVQVGVIGGAGTVQSGSGDVQIEATAGALLVKTGSGDIAVARAEDDVKVQTGSGDVSIGRVHRGRVKAQAASGDLRVGVADGTPAWLDVKTVTGGVRSDLDSTETVGAEEEHVRVELNTVSGDIEIARA